MEVKSQFAGPLSGRFKTYVPVSHFWFDGKPSAVILWASQKARKPASQQAYSI
jgi:hypothetical protein